jgi:hypothetical protein
VLSSCGPEGQQQRVTDSTFVKQDLSPFIFLSVHRLHIVTLLKVSAEFTTVSDEVKFE